MHPFLQALAHHLTHHPTPLQHHIVVLPTQRAAYYLRRILAGQHNIEGWLPRCMTFNTFAEEVSGMQSADRLQLKFTCYEAYKNVLGAAANDLSSFFAWADTLIDDFNDIESQEIDPHVIFRALKDYNDIDRFSFLDEPLSARQQRYQVFWESLKDIHQQFNASLLERRTGYPGLVAKQAASQWPTFAEAHPNIYITAAGFNALSKTEGRLLQQIQADGRGSILFDTDPAWLGDDENHAGLFVRRHLKNGLGQALSLTPPLADRQVEVTWSEAPNKAAQAGAVAALLQGLTPDQLADTALVLADESMLVPILNRLPPSVTEANVTMGIPLSDSALSHWISLIFELHERASRDESGTFVLSERLQSIVQHPFALLIAGRDATLPAPDLRAVYMPLDAFRQKSEEAAAPWLAALMDDWQRNAAAAAASLTAFVEAAIAQVEALQPEGLQARMAGDGLAVLARLLRKLNSIAPLTHLDTAALQSLVTDAFRSSRISLIGEPAKGLQIMGLLETRALHYKRIVLCDANEDILPGKPQLDSFIPFEIRGYYKMPGKREKEATYAHLFYRLLHGADHMHLVYHVDNTGPWGAEPTRYLAQLNYHLAPQLPGLSVAPLPIHHASTPAPPRRLRLEKDPHILADIERYLTTRISASGLNRYFESPLEWYYEYVLQLDVPEEEGLLDVATFGTLVHSTLEALYNTYGQGHRLKPDDAKAMYDGCAAALERTFAQSDRVGRFDKGLNRLHFETALQMLKGHLRREAESVAQGEEVSLEATELKMGRTLRVDTATGSIEAKFTGFADLILRRDGTLRVIDFKTGKVEKKDLSIGGLHREALAQKPKAVQLLLYAWMAANLYPGESVEAQIISLPRPSARDLMPGILLDDQEKMADFEAALREVLLEMLDPEVPLVARASFKYAQFEPALAEEEE